MAFICQDSLKNINGCYTAKCIYGIPNLDFEVKIKPFSDLKAKTINSKLTPSPSTKSSFQQYRIKLTIFQTLKINSLLRCSILTRHVD